MVFLKKLIKFKKRYGLKLIISQVFYSLINKFNLLSPIDCIRTRINLDISEIFQNKVAYGIFKGMKLSNNIWWGKFDIATKLLGQYELHILDKIIDLSDEFETFIDIGAADGYYAVGAVFSNLYSKSICFEISEFVRQVIEENSTINQVSDKIQIHGIANQKLMSSVLEIENKALILIDIEGGEFDLLTNEFLLVCKNSKLIIELHDSFIKGSDNRRNDLFKRANMYFDITYLQRVNPDIYSFKELENFDDNFRQLVFSEGRPPKMEWVLFSPKYF